MAKLTQEEIKAIKDYDYNFDPALIIASSQAAGQAINDVLIISKGRRGKHDSGYPFIFILGRQYTQGPTPNVKYFDLGWHDHCLCNIPVNIDSYGKNVFRIMPWMGIKAWQVNKYFTPVSTFEIGSKYTDISPENTIG